MADSTFQIDILANIEKSVSSIKGLAASVDKEVSKINKTFSGLAGLATGALATIGVGFSLKAVIDEAVASEEAVNRFNVVLKQTKIFTEEGSKAFEDYALALQRSTGVADEAILELSASLQRFAGLSQRDLATVTKATLDFAKFADLDFNTAAQAVGKALQGSEGALQRYGIQVKNGKNETEQLVNVLKGLEIAQGSAEARAKTFGGQIQIIQGEFSQLLETIGGAVINNNALGDSLNLVRSLLIQFTNAVTDSSSGISTFVTGVVFLGRTFIAAGDVIYRIFVTAIDAIIVSMSKAGRVIVDLTAKTLKFFKIFGVGTDLIDSAQDSLERFSLLLQGTSKAGEDSIKKSFTDPIIGFNTEVKKSKESVDDLIKTLGSTKGKSFGLKDDLKNLQEERKLKEEADVREQEARDKIIKAQIKAEEDFKKGVLNSASSFLGSVQQGAAGVSSAFANIAAFATDILFPGFGQLVGGLISFLAQGPEAVRAQIQAFIDNIPVIIDAIVQSIPVVIEVLAANAPKIALSLSNQMPFVATSLSIALIQNMPNIAKGFVDGLIAESGRLVTAIADGVKQAISQVTSLGGGGRGGILGAVANPVAAIGRKLRFADGGIVPGGFPNDSFPAQLTSGEGVIPVDTMRRLDQYLSRADAGSGQSSGGGTTIIKLVVGEQELANVLLSLNQRGFRVS